VEIAGPTGGEREATGQPGHDPTRQGPEEELRLSFNAALLGMTPVSLRPDSFGRLLRVNQALCEFLGYSEQEPTRMTFGDIVHPDDLPGTGRC
jgi:PAS domain-containing protein